MKERTTVQDLVDACVANQVSPAEAVLLLRQPCMAGDDQMDFLCNPQLKLDAKALDLSDERVVVDLAISLDHADLYFDWDGDQEEDAKQL